MTDEPNTAPIASASEPMSDADSFARTAVPTPDFAATVKAWFAAHIASSPISRSVDAINHLNEKLPLLIAALEGKE